MAGHGRILLAAGGLLTAAVAWAAVEHEPRSHRTADPRAAALEDLSAQLEARERSIERREQSAVDKERELRAIEERLKARTSELEALRTEIDGLRARVDAEHDVRVAMVVKSVEAMKPSAAAAMVGELDRSLAIEVIKKMNKGKAGKLLAALPPEIGARLTEGVAGPGGTVGTGPRTRSPGTP